MIYHNDLTYKRYIRKYPAPSLELEAQSYLQKTVNRIMVVLQGETQESLEALRYAAGLSKLCGASVLLVCLRKLPLPPVVGAPSPLTLAPIPTRFWDQEDRRAKEIAAESKEILEGMGVETEVEVLSTFDRIGWVVGSEASKSCDLVIVSETKTRGFWQLFRADLAADVVKHTDCPVMVIQEVEKDRR